MDSCHAFCLAATSSGSGKTTLALGLMRALARRGLKVSPFKCGPDYIDPEFHKIAAKAESINLDLWMMGEDGVKRSFERRLAKNSCAVVEGVMGLFDGVSPSSIEGSTAKLAITLGIPVVLVLDASGMAGTLAAIVSGCASFAPQLEIAGVIANFVSSESHRKLLAEALKSRGLPPLLGCLPPNPEWALPERHLGLVPEKEVLNGSSWYDSLAMGVERGIDFDLLLETTSRPVPQQAPEPPRKPFSSKLAVAMDDAFHFYYRDNFDALEAHGVELAFFSPLDGEALPRGASGLYLGGGYPEVFADELSSNLPMRSAIRSFAESGRPIYAECGGLMYLCRSLQDSKGESHRMCGLFDCDVEMGSKLHRLGYRETRTLKDSLLGPAGSLYRGHEFHWSKISELSRFAMDAAESRGAREGARWEPSAFSFKNVYASYIHAHFAYNEGALAGIAASLASAAPLL